MDDNLETALAQPGAFYVMWVQESNQPVRKMFTGPTAETDAIEHATLFTRRIRRPVHVLKVIATIEVTPDPVSVTRY